MAVDDYGIEVLKKSGEEVIPGNKSDYYIKTKLLDSNNSELNLETNESNQLDTDCFSVDEYGNYYQLLSDNIFGGAIVAITPEHHEIHCGDSYLCTRIADIGNGATDEILIIVPDEAGTGQEQKLYHLKVDGISESEGEWGIYESPTYSNAGTSLTSYNQNRNSTNNDVLGITHTPTISNAGTLLETVHVGSGRGIGSEQRTDEWVLKNNTVYLLRFTNFTTTSNYITWRMNYYVHPGI